MIDALISPPIPDPLPRPAIPLRLAILASGNGSNMEAIASAIERDHLYATIQVVIFNNPQAKVAERAQSRKLPTVLLNHRDYESRETFDRDIVKTIKVHQADWVIMAGWMRRVTQVLIDAFPQRILNIHPSVLPSFPGVRAVEQALAAGTKVAGCTVHYVELKIDSGPILVQAVVPIEEGDTADILQMRIQAQEHHIYPAAIAIAACQSSTL